MESLSEININDLKNIQPVNKRRGRKPGSKNKTKKTITRKDKYILVINSPTGLVTLTLPNQEVSESLHKILNDCNIRSVAAMI